MSHRRLLSTSEFAQLSGIPRSTLIYYDQIGLFSPVARGDNTYRYYSLNQLIAAGFVNDMASFGVPLKDLIQLTHDRDPVMMCEVLEKKIADHQSRIAELRESVDVMSVIAYLISKGQEAEGINIEVKEYEPYGLIMGGENPFQDTDNFFPGFLTFLNIAKRSGLNIKYPVGGYYDSVERYMENPNIPSRYYFVHPRGKEVRPGGTFLAGYERGYYGTTSDLHERMMAYAKDHGLELTGPVYNTYLLDEICIPDPNEYLLRASIQIANSGQETLKEPQLRKRASVQSIKSSPASAGERDASTQSEAAQNKTAARSKVAPGGVAQDEAAQDKATSKKK
jgi:DNA-binding transcriptional MerR regulator